MATTNANARFITAKVLASDMGISAKTLRAFVRTMSRYDDDRYTRYEWTAAEAKAVRDAYKRYRDAHTSHAPNDAKRNARTQRAATQRAAKATTNANATGTNDAQ